MEDRLISAASKPEEFETENSLRPSKLEDYIGQEKVKETISIFIQAALG
ncbi:MAG: Holliday junction branch migration DNA helicase RuvB, partial [Desulfotomaculaceae bacterium]|nr:Holliday junction branch migration DNA helicase RuvB [Desulfotomaculaceae bacterium]